MSNTSEPRKKRQIAVLASGGGSNLQALIDGCQSDRIHGKIRVVASNKRDAYALSRAKNAGIEHLIFEPQLYASRTLMCSKMAAAFKEREIDLICLAGYLLKIEPCLIRSFPNRILNIHPALLPKYGGKGMYGHHVHEAVLKAQEKTSGCSVHLVDEIFDHGRILAQTKVPVESKDTPDTLAARILPKEHELYVSVVKKICEGKIDLDRKEKSETLKR